MASIRATLAERGWTSRWQIPSIYLALVMSMWAVDAPYLAGPPLWKTLIAPGALTLLALAGLFHWWRTVGRIPLEADIPQTALTRTGLLAFSHAALTTCWFFQLSLSAPPHDRISLGFFLATTIISCIVCLKRMSFSVVAAIMLVNAQLIAFFAATPSPDLFSMAMFMIAMLAILAINLLDFTRTSDALAEARQKQKDQNRLLRMIDDMPVAVMTVDPVSFKITYVNETSKTLIRSIEHLLRIKADELLGASVDVFHRHPEHQQRILADAANLPHNARINLGSEVLDLKVSAIMDDDGRYLGPMLTWAIVTSEVEKEQEQRRLLRMIDDMPVAVMTVDPHSFKMDYVNETSKTLIRSIEHLLPIKADELLGASVDVFHRHPEHQRGILADAANLPHNARIRLGNEVLELKVSAITADDGRYLGPMLTWAIVTKEVEAENRIRQLAHYDTLTGLANRVTFKEQLEASLALRGEGPVLLFIDLDGFKMVNDTEGHRVGDELLACVAARLRALCDRPGIAIGRLGGDEFAVMMPFDALPRIEAFASEIISGLSAPYGIGAHRQLHIGASIGIAVAPRHGETGDTLLARADIALYVAKAAGKGTHRIFSEQMEDRIHERMRLHSDLRDSLEEGQGLFLFYQPIVDIATRRTTCREALMRWYHPARGWVSPAEFIPVAEQSSLIDQLGEFQLETACREAASWEDGARVAVNVSAAQFGKGTIAQIVLSALTRSGLSPDRLEIEITETAMLGDERGVTTELRRIRGMGVRVALDDFGTGYSSLTHLRSFPFDKIKIDGSFVKDAVKRTESAAVVRAIADLGKRLGVTTVAEGVETEAHLTRVIEEGCTEVQGYYFGRPSPSKSDMAAVNDLDERAHSLFVGTHGAAAGP